MSMVMLIRSKLEWATQEKYRYCLRISRINLHNKNNINCNSSNICRRIQVAQRYSKKMLRRMITVIITITIYWRVISLRTTKHCIINWKCSGMIQKNKKNILQNQTASLTTAGGSRRDKVQVKHRRKMKDI